MENKKVTLPSGAELEISISPFKDAKKLYQAIASELKGLSVNPTDEVDVNFLKNIICAMIESDKVDSALLGCLKRCLYNKKRIDEDTFEPVEARQDYFTVCVEVAKENVAPFMKNLSAVSADFMQKINGISA